ncbi:MAG: amidohydrolase family protein [Geobacteraceae bacterium]|nr:amidohydrolase family protein [Geobacteraceae bacterium]
MGNNNGNSAGNCTKEAGQQTDLKTFRVRVVEHLSWDSYDEKKKCFLPGHEKNKPVANREFKIKMPDGSIIPKTTDEEGMIELTGREETDIFEVIFETSSEESKEKHHIFYNRCTPVDKDSNNTTITKADLMCGGWHHLSILRFTVIIDSHMHIMSSRCSPLKWVQNISSLTKHMKRETIEGLATAGGYLIEVLNVLIPITWFFKLPFTKTPARKLSDQGKKSTRESADDFIKEQKKTYEKYFKGEKLYSGLSRLFMPAVVMTMDMEYAHIDGYYGLKIYNPLYETKDAEFISGMETGIKKDKVDGYDDLKIYKALYKYEDNKRQLRPIAYWFPVHGKWVAITELVNAYPYETMVPNYVPVTTQQFEEIADRDESRYVKVPSKEPSARPIDLREFEQGLGRNRLPPGSSGNPVEKENEPFLIGSYFDAGENKTVAVQVQAAPVLASEQEVSVYEQWERQLLYTELATLKHPLKLLPMFHYDPRRWQTYGVSGNAYPFSQVRGDNALYLGFKMYTAQGYKPLDSRLPIMEDFYARCCRDRIPILNHCTPKGASTYEKREYPNFYHLNDSEADKKKQKEAAANKCDAEDYFDEHYVSPNAWKKLLDATVGFNNEKAGLCEMVPLKDLYLCLAHFGGPSEKGLKWNKQIIDMILEEAVPQQPAEDGKKPPKAYKYPNLYTDISSSFADEGFRDHFTTIIAKAGNERLRERILFGTDWYMTFSYNPLTNSKNFRQYCEAAKECLDKIDRSLWPRFTQVNPYNFYRLDKEIGRIAKNIIKRRDDEDVRKFLKRLETEDEEEIRREAAYLQIANEDYLNLRETINLWKP